MIANPCPVCGYDAPQAVCPHCASRPLEGSLQRRLSGPLTGVLDGLMAVPRGLYFLATTRGVKRWLIPPMIVTSALLVALLWWTFTAVDQWVDSALPAEFAIEGHWAWLESLSERWDWLKSTWAALVGAAQWLVNTAWAFVTSQPLRVLTWFFVGSLVAWYCFSIAYEALAGPFLDEIQGRLESRWFGEDPRSRLERPNDIPSERCARLTIAASAGAALVFLALLAVGVTWYLAALAGPLVFLVPALVDRRYGPWLVWIAKVESRAAWASLQASILTGVLLLFALPLYFVPIVGYFLFAGVTGFATAVGLLDIPLERRGWKLRQRLRFILRNLPAMIAFGVVSGFLLAIPLVGPILMVPAASVGGLWLVCRLDKSFLRSPGRS